MALAYDTSEQPSPEEIEARLLRMLKSEEEQALSYAQSEINEQQIDALQRFYGEKYGDEEEGRSQVCTREVLEVIEWTRPDLMRVFASGGNVVYLEETSQEDARYAQDAADYLQWIFFSDNPGFQLLDDFAFDGLLTRRGYLACYWSDKEYRTPQTVTGLNITQVQQLMSDPSVEILGQDFDGEGSSGISLSIRRVKSPARAVIESIAPEDMRLQDRIVDIDTARYVGRVHRMLCGEAATQWPDKADEIIAQCGAQQDHSFGYGKSVRDQRFQDGTTALRIHGNEAAQEVEVLEEYLRCDLNDDGYPELIRSYRIAEVLLEQQEVEENPFASWTPIRVPHRFMGMSFHDIVQDLQRRSTVLNRAALDAVYQSVVQREYYDRNKIGEDGVAAMLSTVAGTKVPVDGDPTGIVWQAPGAADTAQVAWEALNQLSVTLENRTGATRQTQGLDPDALLKGPHSGKAIDLLQSAGGARKEMTARNMADGLAGLFSKLYRLVCRNQNEERQAKVGGKWCQFDPRTWNSDLRVVVHTGLGTGNREQTLQGLMMIRDEQNQVIEALGPGNPNVTMANRFAVQEEMCRVLGYRSGDRFFSEVPDVPDTDEQGQPVPDPETGQPKMKPWSPPPQQDPAMAKVEADTQAKQAQMQIDMQAMQASQQLEEQKTVATLQLKKQTDEANLQAQQEKAALDLQLAREKASAEIALADRKAQAEMDLAWAQFEAEMALAREKQTAEIAMQRESLEAQREMHSEKTQAAQDMHSEKVSADVKISKNRPGGDLDK